MRFQKTKRDKVELPGIFTIIFLSLFLLSLSRILNNRIYMIFQQDTYLTLHVILEFLSVLVSMFIAVQCLITYPYSQRDRQFFLGIIFLIVGVIDFLHTTSYKGMPFLSDGFTGGRSTYFWVIARLTESVGILVFLINRIPRKKISISLGFLYLCFVSFSILLWEPFLPPLLKANGEMTLLKIIIEYGICLIQLASILILVKRYLREKKISYLKISTGLFLILLSELIFTLYKNTYDIDNLLGHVYKVVGYIYIFNLFVKNQVKEPYVKRKHSEERFNKVFRSSPVLMSIIRKSDLQYLDVNDLFLKKSGYAFNEVVGKTLQDLNISKNWADLIISVTENQNIVTNREIPLINKAGKTLGYALTSSENLLLNNEECILFSLTDVTELKKLKSEIVTSKDHFSKAFHYSPILKSIIKAADLTYVDVNQRFLDTFGLKREKVIGKTLDELGVSRDIYQKVITVIKKQGEARNIEIAFPRELNVTMLISGVPMDVNGEKCFMLSYNDITELKQTQAELARLDRLNLVGELAAGIGHEIRNPMATVRGYLQLLGSKKDLAPHKSKFDLMISELDRANSIITEFLSLARSKETELQYHDLNVILNNLYPLLEADTFNQNKQIRFLPGDIPQLPLNSKEITQLILNLARNGLEAMEARGCLTIQTQLINNQVVLSMTDQGCGIPPELMDKLGTPFFTTKENGTGLGLATCYRIADSNNARIDVDSSPEGTTFYVKFDILKEQSEALVELKMARIG